MSVATHDVGVGYGVHTLFGGQVGYGVHTLFGGQVGQGVGLVVGVVVGLDVKLGASVDDGDWLGRSRHGSPPINTPEILVVSIEVLSRKS